MAQKVAFRNTSPIAYFSEFQRRKIMKTLFNTLIAAATAAMLAACGGGGGGGTTSTAGGVTEAIAAMEGNWGTGNNCIVAFGAEFATPQSYTGTRVYTKTGDNTVAVSYTTSYFSGAICVGVSGQPNATGTDTLTIDGSEVINGIRYIRYTENSNGNKALMGISADGTQIFSGRPLAATANTTAHPTEIISGFSSTVTGNFISQALIKNASVTMPARNCEQTTQGFKVCGVEIRGASGAALSGYSETVYNNTPVYDTISDLDANGNGMNLKIASMTDNGARRFIVSPQDGSVFNCRAQSAPADTRLLCNAATTYSNVGGQQTFDFGRTISPSTRNAANLMKTGITGTDRLNPANYMAVSGKFTF
jgi:hypothetical protein